MKSSDLCVASEILWEAIHALSFFDRELITGFYFEKRSTHELARMLGIRQKVVKYNLFRVRKRLAKILQHRNMEPT